VELFVETVLSDGMGASVGCGAVLVAPAIVEVDGAAVEVAAAAMEVDAAAVEVDGGAVEGDGAALAVDGAALVVEGAALAVVAGEVEVDAGAVGIGAGALQTRNVISSMTRSFPYPPGAFEIINKVTDVLVAVNERPYFPQVSCCVADMFPELISASKRFPGCGVRT
jgi:hypothetical protein